ncbi:thermonuclease family protein [Bhargavaea ullalensis]|uniref:Endonuclease YncB(Thermonuclease family) n=1 Tax=Bhargavaea ullalensis TaxID=1265685 RepID=A0ABV2GDT0_9BACL
MSILFALLFLLATAGLAAGVVILVIRLALKMEHDARKVVLGTRLAIGVWVALFAAMLLFSAGVLIDRLYFIFFAAALAGLIGSGADFLLQLAFRMKPSIKRHSKVAGAFLAAMVIVIFAGPAPDQVASDEEVKSESAVAAPTKIADIKEAPNEETAKREAEEVSQADEKSAELKSVEVAAVPATAKTRSAAQESVQKEAAQPAAASNRVPVTLANPIDGDTIKVNIDGRTESVRFLLVDTPETNHPRLGVQPFGREAKEFTTKLVQSGSIELEFDVSDRDKYNRLLAYVYVDGVSVQEELLKKGLARVAYVYAPNTKYVDRYDTLQKEAQQQAVGIWSVENYATDRGFDAAVVNGGEQASPAQNMPKPKPAPKPAPAPQPKPAPQPQQPAGACNIKGNASSHIYHKPGGQYYDRTNAEVMFCSEAEAQAAGYRASKR